MKRAVDDDQARLMEGDHYYLFKEVSLEQSGRGGGGAAAIESKLTQLVINAQLGQVREDGATTLLVQELPFPWPLTPRYYGVVQEYIRVRSISGGTWFYTYNHDVDHPRMGNREGFVRLNVRYQGMVGMPLRVSRRNERTGLTWLVNMDAGGIVPTKFATRFFLYTMIYPRAQLIQMERGWSASEPLSPSQDNEAQAAVDKRRDAVNLIAPQNLTIEDCLIDSFRGKSIHQQRAFFQMKMTEMAKEGCDEELGWKYKGLTHARNVPPEKQIEVYERTVEWSAVKQMRAVVETDFSCEDVFDSAIKGFEVTERSMSKLSEIARGADEEIAISGFVYIAYEETSQNGVIALCYREIPFPWPFASRYAFIVQDFLKLKTANGTTWFVCYNHDIDHLKPFQHRSGFERARVKYQGESTGALSRLN